MLPFARCHAATILDLKTWSTLSRNEVGPFLARFGIEPLGRKYPMLRVYEHLLGLSPSDADEDDMLGGGLIRVTKVAERFGVSGDDLLHKLRAPGNAYPPLYAFGPKRNLMLTAQVEQMLASPRNTFHGLAPIHGHALPASRLARTPGVPQARIDAMLADKHDLPAHIISQGRVRYIVSNVAHRLASRGSDEKAAAEEDQQAGEVTDDAQAAGYISTDGEAAGLFSAATKHAVRHPNTQGLCTGSRSAARRGDCLHGAPTEAKLSGT